MLKVKTKLLRMPSRSNSLIRALVERANDDARGWAAILRADFSGLETACDLHPDEPSLLIVVAQRNGFAIVNKSRLCCKHFAAKFEFDGDVMEDAARHQYAAEQVEQDVTYDPLQLWLWPAPIVMEPSRAFFGVVRRLSPPAARP